MSRESIWISILKASAIVLALSVVGYFVYQGHRAANESPTQVRVKLKSASESTTQKTKSGPSGVLPAKALVQPPAPNLKAGTDSGVPNRIFMPSSKVGIIRLRDPEQTHLDHGTKRDAGPPLDSK